MADWTKIGSRGNVEDRRSMAPAAVGGLSLTGVALLFLVNYLSGGNVTDVLNQLQNTQIEQRQIGAPSQAQYDQKYTEFASTVLGSGNEMWSKKFTQLNKTYEEPKLVLFRTATESGCGTATSEIGPHYCPEDKTIYLDETFFSELTSRFGAKGGDVAQAYVIAHELGHHAQNELGILNNSSAQYTNANQQSVKTELQADCFAGLWANSLKDENVFENGEINEAIDAAAAVGDDRIQKRANGYTNPETWTHGSSEQRVSWFNKGYESGTLSACDTFK